MTKKRRLVTSRISKSGSLICSNCGRDFVDHLCLHIVSPGREETLCVCPTAQYRPLDADGRVKELR